MAAHSARKFGRGGQESNEGMPRLPNLGSDPEENIDMSGPSESWWVYVTKDEAMEMICTAITPLFR